MAKIVMDAPKTTIEQADNDCTPNARWSSFGVGCFHFVAKLQSTKSGTLNSRDYYSALRKAISDIPSITEIDIVETLNFSPYRNVDWKVGDFPDISQNYGIHPWPQRSTIAFTIFIPKRIQEELTKGFRTSVESELFRVKIIYKGGIPVTLIKSIDAYVNDPSTMVTLVWKYLKKYMSATDHGVDFQIIGPSPFHADFYICTHDSPKYDVEYKERRGYDVVNISAPMRETNEEIWSTVEFRIHYEFSKFYQTIQERNKINRQVRAVLREQRYNPTNLFIQYTNTFKKLREIGDAP